MGTSGSSSRTRVDPQAHQVGVAPRHLRHRPGHALTASSPSLGWSTNARSAATTSRRPEQPTSRDGVKGNVDAVTKRAQALRDSYVGDGAERSWRQYLISARSGAAAPPSRGGRRAGQLPGSWIRRPAPGLSALARQLNEPVRSGLLVAHGPLVSGVAAKCHEFGQCCAVTGGFGEAPCRRSWKRRSSRPARRRASNHPQPVVSGLPRRFLETLP